MASVPVDEAVPAFRDPLVRDAARKILVQPKLKVHLWVERAIRFFEQPAPPVRVLLSNLADFRATAPARAMIVPNDLDLADFAQRAGLDEIADGDLVWLAAVLRADLNHQVSREDSK